MTALRLNLVSDLKSSKIENLKSQAVVATHKEEEEGKHCP
jgi:hypothetical protein